MRTDIKWAGRIEASSGGGIPGLALGAPDCQSAGVLGPPVDGAVGQSATYFDWHRASYDGLAGLLGGAFPPGDIVTPEMLAAADIVTFEMNGNSPGVLGGWESAIFDLRDSQGSVRVEWVDRIGFARDPHVIANGSITGDRYGAFFNIPPDLVTTAQPMLSPQQVVVSFLLLRIRGEINVTGDAFRLTLSSPPGGSPDPDAIGVLLHADQQPARPVKPSKSPTRQVIDLCAKLQVDYAISYALASLWQRRNAGQPARNSFEQSIYATFDGLSAPAHAAIDFGFNQFAEFRALKTTNCLFTDRLADIINQRPLEPADFAEELISSGLGVARQALSPATDAKLGPGIRRLWRDPVFAETAGVRPPLPTPHITAVRHDMKSNQEFFSVMSMFPAPGHPFVAQDYQLSQVCTVRPTLDGAMQDCKVRTPDIVGGTGSTTGVFPVLQCDGGRDYSFGSNCLELLTTSVGTSLVLRGFNFTSSQVLVHLRLHDHPERPISTVESMVFGDRETPAADAGGAVIADTRVQDFVDVKVPSDEPGESDTPLRPGLYDVWVTVPDTTNPAAPVNRDSNVIVVRVEPRRDLVFKVINPAGYCAEATSGPGNDEIWWTVHAGSLFPASETVTPGQVSTLEMRDLRRIEMNYDAWSDMSAGKHATYDQAIQLWPAVGPPRRFEPGEVGVYAILGLEVDSEDEAKELLRGFWSAFGEALKVVVVGAVGAVSVGESAAKVLAKLGLQVTVTASAVVIGAAIALGVTFAGLCLWSSWAPADIVGLDVVVFDALTLALATDGLQPLPAPTERSWRVEGDWQIVRERPQPKLGNAGSTRMTWVQQNEYLSGAENSRYVLEFRTLQREVPLAEP